MTAAIWYIRLVMAFSLLAVAGITVIAWVTAGTPSNPADWYACYLLHLIDALLIIGTVAAWKWKDNG